MKPDMNLIVLRVWDCLKLQGGPCRLKFEKRRGHGSKRTALASMRVPVADDQIIGGGKRQEYEPDQKLWLDRTAARR